MNGLEILGLACVDATFRTRLFGDVESIIKENTDLTWAEEAGLRRITGKTYRPRQSKGDKAALANGPLEPGKEMPNTLEGELAEVGANIARMCPEEPCPWPDFYTQTKPKK